MAPKPKPPEVRFFAKVVEATSGCWIWTACTSPAGYGRFGADGKRPVFAHRWSYEFMRGEIPAGLVLDHLCRRTNCVNPWHLEPVTDQVNVLRGRSLAAQRKAQTHCKRGHEFTPENTATDSRRRRVCRACRALHNARVTELRRAGVYTSGKRAVRS